MVNYLILLSFLFEISLGTSENCDKYGILLYEDIGCEGNVKTEEGGCPSSFKCDFNRPKTGCVLKNINFHPGEAISSNLTYSGCMIGCTCEDFDFIRCAILDCPEYLYDLKDGCYNEYVLEKCCATGVICKNETDNEKTCQVDDEIYAIGQKFYPKNTCLECVCHENFTGKYDEKTCTRLNCVSQIHYTEEINRKCAPAYFNFRSNEVLCCPDHFICPDPNDFIKWTYDESKKNSTLECEYGNQKLKYGEGFERRVNKLGKDRHLRCECILPPLVTCREV
ncbi:hypothetical protein ABEB36_008192 [Hypothenemus hampei]|uniref:VWFC domain-containing protein n=1 Tax=Hypothenemus hampei TaxID=57062 RepID=A0ABD1EL29_HYPHA